MRDLKVFETYGGSLGKASLLGKRLLWKRLERGDTLLRLVKGKKEIRGIKILLKQSDPSITPPHTHQ